MTTLMLPAPAGGFALPFKSMAAQVVAAFLGRQYSSPTS
jgi:hypothetical protein